jgi:multiple sugar transport system ATP-binding protein
VPSIVLQDVIKSFTAPDGRSVLAADSVNLSVEDGELLALVGPSGCGKTTLLRLIAGLESADHGKILFGDLNVTHSTPRARDVAMVFQSLALFPHMTASENIAFGLKLRGVQRSEIAARVRETASMMGVTHCLDRKPGKLSGGERQRVALVRALVRQPKILLLDEPFSNLDEPLRIQLRNELPGIRARSGATVIFVTHDQEEALAIGDRVAVMRNGAIQQVASPCELYSNPANRFVATFIGSPQMNLIHGVAAHRDGRIVFIGAEAEPEVTLPGFILDTGGVRADWFADNVDRKILIGFRPEDVSLVETSAAMIRARVVSVQFIGSETVLQVRAAERDIRLRSRRAVAQKPGDDVGLFFDFDRVKVFEAATGAMIRLQRDL